MISTSYIKLTQGAGVTDVSQDLEVILTLETKGVDLHAFFEDHPAVEKVMAKATQLQSLLKVW